MLIWTGILEHDEGQMKASASLLCTREEARIDDRQDGVVGKEMRTPGEAGMNLSERSIRVVKGMTDLEEWGDLHSGYHSLML